MDTKPYNPLREIMEIVGEGESVQYAHYDGWVMHIPEGTFKFTVGEGKFEEVSLSPFLSLSIYICIYLFPSLSPSLSPPRSLSLTLACTPLLSVYSNQVLKKFGGPNALQEWVELNKRLVPIIELSAAIPPLVLRSDPTVPQYPHTHASNSLSPL